MIQTDLQYSNDQGDGRLVFIVEGAYTRIKHQDSIIGLHLGEIKIPTLILARLSMVLKELEQKVNDERD